MKGLSRWILVAALATPFGCSSEPESTPCSDCNTADTNISETPDGGQSTDQGAMQPDAGAADDTGTSSSDAGSSDDTGSGTDQGALGCNMGDLRAFPGAEGFGAGTAGGRGGDVYVVTSLEDAGPGTLREAVEAEGPRTVVFAVGGTIELQDVLAITNSNITINGATAPGGGIALRTAPSVTGPAIRINADDVIVRYLRARPGPSADSSTNVDALTVTGGNNIVIANNSFSWATDENVNLWYDPSNVTIQDNLVSECLWNSNHPNGAHSKGFLSGPEVERISLIRNVFASNDDRNPQVQSPTSYELVNNIGYNGYQVGATLVLTEDTKANVVGNVYLAGPNHRPSRYQIIGSADTVPDGVIWVEDNITPRSDPNDPWAVMGWGGIHGGDYNGSPLPANARAATAFEMSDYPATPIAAADLTATLLPTVGASLPTRDSADTRVIADIEAGTGGLIDSTDEVGGWPTLDAGQAPADADADGLPDAWETAHGLDPNDPSDSAADRNGDGYTNIEEFLECP